ncbi:hypothetical protein [Psychroserpens ponticola]|uniref:Uncharacterized protein n=1 Tax=Psychroserpens ponticola TaxID=2932268 RepID=A0ABY7RUU0_9FLAO|nr:hypothetical protein [Psychroserpens ponticola]WCO00738.1 hypothetical protein MUN68_011740 [Psychroserpens ponticola]
MKKQASKDQITRKEALTKMGKYAALTAIGSFIILNPKQAQASSPPDPGGNPFE